MAERESEAQVKGKIAEGIVQFMFEQSKMVVGRLEVEHLCAKKVRSMLIKASSDPAVRCLLKSPDFIITRTDGGIDFVDVKYCQQGRLHPDQRKDVVEQGEIWHPVLLVVSNNSTAEYNIKHQFAVADYPHEFTNDRNLLKPISVLEKKG